MFELYLLTFNCARNLVDPQSLAPPLFDALPSDVAVPDIIAVSLQEISPIAYSFLGGSYLTPYFERVTATVELAAKLRSHGTERLQHVATRSLGMTALMIFARPHVAEKIQWIQSAGAGVGFWNMGNKGAVAMRLGLSGPSAEDVLQLTFVGAHLAPMERNIAARNRDWENIVRNMVFVNEDTSGYSSSETVPLLSSVSVVPPEDGTGMFSAKNHIFFAGDLNYRTHDTPPGPNAHKSYPQPVPSDSSPAHYSHLLTKDQLIREKDANRTLHGFHELPITFPPTYKLSMNSRKDAVEVEDSSSGDVDRWTWAKHRYPSWCDRILFTLSTPPLQPQIYTALPIQPTSDHRPVALSLRVDKHPITLSTDGDGSKRSPFPINPSWRSRKETARRLEVIVGILSYLALTKAGNAIVIAVSVAIAASWWMSTWLSSR
ncbi:Endonuclease/exonuclease/phosphatase [Dendryphion nanum]|uniref:Endonuclease/exonuclease/phosphatase n=1 Tax=Dendryphion nanum TaxID=256645 RepID=A0A9P9I9Y6_9PLEO|nr:Endonuclease/exonuclease/phosphatase [Dendryphion nanum]